MLITILFMEKADSTQNQYPHNKRLMIFYGCLNIFAMVISLTFFHIYTNPYKTLEKNIKILCNLIDRYYVGMPYSMVQCLYMCL